jgi:hypothetical protein
MTNTLKRSSKDAGISGFSSSNDVNFVVYDFSGNEQEPKRKKPNADDGGDNKLGVGQMLLIPQLFEKLTDRPLG